MKKKRINYKCFFCSSYLENPDTRRKFCNQTCSKKYYNIINAYYKNRVKRDALKDAVKRQKEKVIIKEIERENDKELHPEKYKNEAIEKRKKQLNPYINLLERRHIRQLDEIFNSTKFLEMRYLQNQRNSVILIKRDPRISYKLIKRNHYNYNEATLAILRVFNMSKEKFKEQQDEVMPFINLVFLRDELIAWITKFGCMFVEI